MPTSCHLVQPLASPGWLVGYWKYERLLTPLYALKTSTLSLRVHPPHDMCLGFCVQTAAALAGVRMLARKYDLIKCWFFSTLCLRVPGKAVFREARPHIVSMQQCSFESPADLFGISDHFRTYSPSKTGFKTKRFSGSHLVQ